LCRQCELNSADDFFEFRPRHSNTRPAFIFECAETALGYIELNYLIIEALLPVFFLGSAIVAPGSLLLATSTKILFLISAGDA